MTRSATRKPPPPVTAQLPIEDSRKPPPKATPIERSTAGLREALFDTIDGLRAGTVTIQQASAISQAAATIVKSIDTQIKFEALRIDNKIPATLPAMHLIPRIRNAE
jgi:hypothetical protein